MEGPRHLNTFFNLCIVAVHYSNNTHVAIVAIVDCSQVHMLLLLTVARYTCCYC